MDPQKPSGISVSEISLVHCNIGNIVSGVDVNYNLALVAFKREYSERKDELRATAGFDLMHGITPRICDFLVTFRAIYRRKEDSNMTWEEFDDTYCVTHIIPYLREFVGGMTLRMPIKSFIILPPTNVKLLVKKYTESLQHKAV